MDERYCPACDGRGIHPIGTPKPCDTCNGRGKIDVQLLEEELQHRVDQLTKLIYWDKPLISQFEEVIREFYNKNPHSPVDMVTAQVLHNIAIGRKYATTH